MMTKFFKSVVAAAAVLGFWSAPASATLTLDAPCDVTFTDPTASNCSGYWDGNLLNNATVAHQQAAIDLLGGTYSFDGNWAPVEATKILSLSGSGGNQLDFGQVLTGETIFAAHFGNIVGGGTNVTGYWLIDFGSSEATTIGLNHTRGFSNAVLYTTGNSNHVPEPATWMMLLVGFFGMGAVLRRREGEGALKAA